MILDNAALAARFTRKLPMNTQVGSHLPVEQQKLTYASYVSGLGRYFRFGDWPVHIRTKTWYGGLYQTAIRPNPNGDGIPLFGQGFYYTESRVVVGFEIWPGCYPEEWSLVKDTKLPTELVAEALASIPGYGQGTFTAEWSIGSTSN